MAGLPPFGEERSLAKHAKYAKDGTAEIIGETGEDASARGQVVVVLNWFEELQRRLGNS